MSIEPEVGWQKPSIRARHLYEAYRVSIREARPNAPSWGRLRRVFKDIYVYIARRMNRVFLEFFDTSPFWGAHLTGPYILVTNESADLAEFRITYVIEGTKTVTTLFSVHRDRLLDLNRRQLEASIDPSRRAALNELLRLK